MHKNRNDNLIYFKSKWNYPITKVIRVPENLADQLLEIAHQLDNNKDIIIHQDSLVTEQLKKIFAKICNKESGYKSNSATKLINDIKQLNQLSN
jgi:CRISPR/Cas system CSM-associated protein Csm2 small subunit